MEYSSIVIFYIYFLFACRKVKGKKIKEHKNISIFYISLPYMCIPLFCFFTRFETYDTNVHPPSRLGKRVRVAATNVLNINVSAANLETFVDSVLSWRTQLELEQKAIKLNEVKWL